MSGTANSQRVSEILFRGGGLPGARYVSGRVILDEIFSDGRLVTRYWSPLGQVLPEMHLEELNWHWDQPADAFCLSVNGRNLAGGYGWPVLSAGIVGA